MDAQPDHPLDADASPLAEDDASGVPEDGPEDGVAAVPIAEQADEPADEPTDAPTHPPHDEPADVPAPPTTGDPTIDATLVEVAQAQTGTLAERIDAGERAHRTLQGRLSDLGGA